MVTTFVGVTTSGLGIRASRKFQSSCQHGSANRNLDFKFQVGFGFTLKLPESLPVSRLPSPTPPGPGAGRAFRPLIQAGPGSHSELPADSDPGGHCDIFKFAVTRDLR
jgi:hypothetical protein